MSRVRLIIRFCLASSTSALMICCASTSSRVPKPVEKKDLLKNAPTEVIARAPTGEEIESKLKRFETALKTRPRALNKADWALHDELFDAYVDSKVAGQQGTQMSIPARSRLTTDLKSFSLNSQRAVPAANERYRWVKAHPGILYYRQILAMTATAGITAPDAQTLLWNLQNETYWDDYPGNLQGILRQIDPGASLKLPSRLRDNLQSRATDLLRSYLPAPELRDAYSLAQGRYHELQDFAKAARQHTSNHPTPTTRELVAIPETPLFTEVRSEGYESQHVTIFNPGDVEITIDLADFYLQPDRGDVQRIGIAGRSVAQATQSRLETVLYETMIGLGIGLNAVTGEAKVAYEVLTGRDFNSNRNLDWGERVLSGSLGSVTAARGFRYAARAAYAPNRFVATFEENLRRMTRKPVALTPQTLGDVRRAIVASRSTARSIKHTRTKDVHRRSDTL